MRLILKLIAAPLILFLTVLVAVLLFLFSLSSFLLTAASVIMALLGVGLFFINYPVGANRFPAFFPLTSERMYH